MSFDSVCVVILIVSAGKISYSSLYNYFFFTKGVIFFSNGCDVSRGSFLSQQVSFSQIKKKPKKNPKSSTPVQQAERHIRPASRKNYTEEENQGPQKKKKPIPDSESTRHSAQMRIQQSRAAAHRGGSTDPGLAIDSLGRKRKLRSRDKTETKKRVCDTAGEPSSADHLSAGRGCVSGLAGGEKGPSSGDPGLRNPAVGCRFRKEPKCSTRAAERPNHIPTRDSFNSAVTSQPAHTNPLASMGVVGFISYFCFFLVWKRCITLK